MPFEAPRAAVVLSGNELLDGRTRDTNGDFVCDDLSRRGVKVLMRLTVADDRRRLTAAFRHALEAEPDLLVVGGGLGTTHDDLTAECLAESGVDWNGIVQLHDPDELVRRDLHGTRGCVVRHAGRKHLAG